MASTLKSTKAKVRDPEKARAVVDSYACRGVEVRLQEKGSEYTLELAYHDGEPEDSQLPEALKHDQLPNEEDFPEEDDDEDSPDKDGWDAVVDKLYEEKGEEGFLSFVRELALYIESQLLILFSSWTLNYHDHGAQVWHVRPGATEVETQKVL
jgi:hypothetical protein